MSRRFIPVLGVALLIASVQIACSSPAPASTPTTSAAKGPEATVAIQPTAAKTEATLTVPAAATSSSSATSPAATAPAKATGGVAPAATQAPSPSATRPPSPTSPPAASVPQAGEVPRMKSPETGIQVFLWGNPQTGRHIGLATSAGFTWIKQMFQWNHIERDGKGKFMWDEPDRIVKAANQAGLKIVARIDYAPEWAKGPGAGWNAPPQNYEDFGDFIYALVSRYKTGSPYGRIHAFEMWNEPNLAREWGGKTPNAVDYVQLLKTGYLSAKKADPSAVVVSAGLSPTGTLSPEARPDDMFLDEMYRAGAKDYFDVLGAHAAGYKAPPEMSPDELASRKEYGGQRFFGFRRVEDLRQIMVKNGDERKQVMVLEMGWTSDRVHPEYAWHAVSEQEKGEYIVRAYQFAQKNWAPWIGMMSAIYINAPEWTEKDEQFWWAITEPNGTPRASYNYIKGNLP